MEIATERNGSTLTVLLSGRLDSSTAPRLEKTLDASLPGTTDLILDFSDLAYLSSAGLRILLSAQKIMNQQGKMIVKNVNSTIMEVFEITGFSDILTVEN